MKVLNVSAILTCIISLTFLLNGCNKEYPLTTKDMQKEASKDMQKEAAHVIDTDPCELNCLLNAPEVLLLEEVTMLLKMREEEKLARDVYHTLSGSYNLPGSYNLQVFEKISSSEQIHMDKVLCLLIHYDIPDPASTDNGELKDDGEFTDPEIQTLYNDLVAQGEEFLIEALKVGADIEALDIHDLNTFLIETENVAIVSVFENLICGSENHMRTFYKLLTARGIDDYEPQSITEDVLEALQLEAILVGDHARCVIE